MEKHASTVSMTPQSPPVCGILPVDKPPGPTSRHVVNAVQRVLFDEKVGHAGTLDPLASGLLLLCVGPATRLIQYVQRLSKEYVAEFELGASSPSDDLESPVERPALPRCVPTCETLRASLSPFLGGYQQVPPSYSAIKIAGQRAYKLARRDPTVRLAARPVVIHELELLHYDYPHLTLRIVCGAGTYIRALGRDIAHVVNTTAIMTSLRRTRTGNFHVDSALTLDPVPQRDQLVAALQPSCRGVTTLRSVQLSPGDCRDLTHGKHLRAPHGLLPPTYQDDIAICNPAGELVSIVTLRDGVLSPKINLMVHTLLSPPTSP
jgi:tRNA pseudouridine55 synthase